MTAAARVGGMLPVRWPIDDPAQFSELSVAVARRELPSITDRLQATLVGPARWRTTGGYLVCEAPAVRRLP